MTKVGRAWAAGVFEFVPCCNGEGTRAVSFLCHGQLAFALIGVAAVCACSLFPAATWQLAGFDVHPAVWVSTRFVASARAALAACILQGSCLLIQYALHVYTVCILAWRVHDKACLRFNMHAIGVSFVFRVSDLPLS